MCKLLLMTGIQDGPLAMRFMELMAKPMSITNSHGIGYTAVKPDGSIFSQRWLNNAEFFDTANIITPEDLEAVKLKLAELEPFRAKLPKGALDIPLDLNYSQYGDVDFSEIKTLTMHTRWATCGREFANTHPFIDQDVSLVHNGAIWNARFLDVNKISTCDSEAALQTYLTQGVQSDSSKAKQWLNILSGSWAFGVLGRNASGSRILDVVRGSSNLYYLEAGPLGKIFCTNDSDAKAVLREMNIEITKEPMLLPSDSMYRFNALTGECIEDIDVKPVYKGYSSGKTFGHSGGTTTGRTSDYDQSSGMSRKDKEYNDAIMADAMGRNSGFPDVFNSTESDWDKRKVKKYTHNSKEPLIDRLEMHDMVYNTNYADDYESLTQTLREWVKDYDERLGFKAARKEINTLIEHNMKMG